MIPENTRRGKAINTSYFHKKFHYNRHRPMTLILDPPTAFWGTLTERELWK